jgi:hypothetical protein
MNSTHPKAGFSFTDRQTSKQPTKPSTDGDDRPNPIKTTHKPTRHMSKFDPRIKTSVQICGVTRKRIFKSPHAAMQFVTECKTPFMREFHCIFCSGFHLTSKEFDPARRYRDYLRHKQDILTAHRTSGGSRPAQLGNPQNSASSSGSRNHSTIPEKASGTSAFGRPATEGEQERIAQAGHTARSEAWRGPAIGRKCVLHAASSGRNQLQNPPRAGIGHEQTRPAPETAANELSENRNSSPLWVR